MGSVGSGQMCEAEHTCPGAAPWRLAHLFSMLAYNAGHIVHTHTKNVRSARGWVFNEHLLMIEGRCTLECRGGRRTPLALMIPRDEVHMTYNMQQSEHASTPVYRKRRIRLLKRILGKEAL